MTVLTWLSVRRLLCACVLRSSAVVCALLFVVVVLSTVSIGVSLALAAMNSSGLVFLCKAKLLSGLLMTMALLIRLRLVIRFANRLLGIRWMRNLISDLLCGCVVNEQSCVMFGSELSETSVRRFGWNGRFRLSLIISCATEGESWARLCMWLAIRW